MEWISVKDQNPPQDTTLAIVAAGEITEGGEPTIKRNFTMIGYFCEADGWKLTGETYLHYWKLTPIYWLNLPDQPQDK